jgi:hypothetical protein
MTFFLSFDTRRLESHEHLPNIMSYFENLSLTDATANFARYPKKQMPIIVLCGIVVIVLIISKIKQLKSSTLL